MEKMKRLYILVPLMTLSPCFLNTGLCIFILYWVPQIIQLTLLYCGGKGGLLGRVDSLACLPTSLAFVIGGNGESLSPIGQLFPSGRGYSTQGPVTPPAVLRSLRFSILESSLWSYLSPQAQGERWWSRGPQLIPHQVYP